MSDLKQSGQDAFRFSTGVSRWADRAEVAEDLAIQLANALESYAGDAISLSDEEKTLIANAKKCRKANKIHKFYTWGDLIAALADRNTGKKDYVNISVFLED